jgi:hypothetical protein
VSEGGPDVARKLNSERSRLFLAIATSAVCVALALVHMIFPGLKIDLITVGLLLGAALPWLSPILKSIEFPGGLKFELQEFKEEVRREVKAAHEDVEALDRRVEVVERFVFTGAGPELSKRLEGSLTAFRAHIERMGYELGSTPISVNVLPASSAASHAGNVMVVGDKLANDLSVILHEYAHFALEAISTTNGIERNPGSALESSIEAAMADYLVASYLDDPVIARSAIPYASPNRHATRGVRDLANDLPLEKPKADSADWDTHEKSQAWSGWLWDVRLALGAAVTDRAAIDGWIQSGKAGSEFTTAVVLQLSGEDAKVAESMLAKRRERQPSG